VGDWFQITGRGVPVYQATGSTAAVGTVYLATYLPQLVLLPVAGLLADRYDRCRFLIATSAIQVLRAALLAWLASRRSLSLLAVLAVSLVQGNAVASTNTGTLDSTCAAVQAALAQALAVPTDLAHAPEVAAMVPATVAEFGRLDVLVNNAAITFPGDLALFPERLALVLDVDLLAPVLAVQAALPHLRASPLGGAVVNVSSAAVMTPFPVSWPTAWPRSGLSASPSTRRVSSSSRACP